MSNGHERSSAHGALSAGKTMRHMLQSQPQAGSALLRHDGRCLESLPRAPRGLPEMLNLGAASLVARATRQQPCQIRRAAANEGAPESSCGPEMKYRVRDCSLRRRILKCFLSPAVSTQGASSHKRVGERRRTVKVSIGRCSGIIWKSLRAPVQPMTGPLASCGLSPPTTPY